MAVPALAAESAVAVDIHSQPLGSALRDLARQAGVEMLFDGKLTSGIQAPAVRGRLTPGDAIRRLLEGTNLTARQTQSGVWLITARETVPPSRHLAARNSFAPESAEPEILVVGKRSLNFDIRRKETDIQPYDVSTGVSVVRSHNDNVDAYFRSRITPNTQFVSPTLLQTGATNSEIDLRGLGSESTLVLIDGRRMPGLPSSQLAFGQPDLNAIPLHSIDRIETLTGTAGGIFGFGALGGVVNVVLKREYRGADLTLTGGISSRGDAKRLNVEGRIGFSPDGGRTDVMLYLSRTWSQPLLVGSRNFTPRNLQETLNLTRQSLGSLFPSPNSISVADPTGGNLTFKPQFGGTSLGSNRTFLPTGFSGNSPDLVAALTEHAGQFDLRLGPALRVSDLHSNPDVTASILNVRHRFSDEIEAYLDGLIFRNHGRYRDQIFNGSLILDANSPNNPFTQQIALQFPAPGGNDRRINVDSERYTGGVIINLPLRWRGTAEMTLGKSRFDDLLSESFTAIPFASDLNPLGNWANFQQALAQLETAFEVTSRPTNQYREGLLQFAGPLYRTAAGPGTLTLSAERRRERVGAFVETTVLDPTPVFTPNPAHSSTTSSLHAELNSQLFSERAPIFLLKGLAIQLAAHFDSQRVGFSEPSVPDAPARRKTFAGMAYTAGAKTQPLPWLMLRGSYATGHQPPPLLDLISRVQNSGFSVDQDPKRGNSFLFTEGSFDIKTRGNPDLSTIQARTLSLGVVITPAAVKDFRLSLDYSRIRETRDVFFFTNLQTILDHESSFPERVTRASLTVQDKAHGYTGGLITGIDARATNGTRTSVDTLDGRLEWTAPFVGGKLHSYASATMQLHNVQRGLFGPIIERVNFLEGPLKWRANGGIDWSRGTFTIGANLQYFGRYRVFNATSTVLEDIFRNIQGSDWVRPQAYLDLYASRQIPIGGSSKIRSLNIEVGVNNVLNASPPREANFSLFSIEDAGYSRFGDPRLRRFEVVLTSSF